MADAPAAVLTMPDVGPPIPDLVNNILGGKQYISPSYWLGWAADKVCGVNPWDWAAQQFAGDWNAAAEAGQALKQLGQFNQRYADAIDQARKATIPDHWDGNAAQQAQSYFTTLSSALREQISALNDISSQFHSLAAGMEEMAQALQSLFQDLTDWLIAIGISAAATAATSWSIVGGIAGGVATLASIAEAAKVWFMVLDYHDMAWAAVQGFTGLCAGYLGAIHGMQSIDLPGTAYHYPST
ncbi:WXG100 family type VII secretion target [Actinoplanes sp. URMC 104]|uniref:WXG100 family type VII secretion target n=1 Tax=Actinoplanes sp. URMC 104 TaxID=3423409 RepID=UPI003F1DCC82